MKKLAVFFVSISVVMLSACSPVKMPVKDQYQLSAYSSKQLVKKNLPITLLVTAPDAAGGYQTEQMLYIKKPYELEAFAKNAWVNPPADMLYPLILQSLQKTNLFEAVTSNAYALGADYRLDTQLLSLNQNFLKKPSIIEFSVKIVLTHVSDNKILSSRIINLRIPCPSDTPYGGVIAANKATQQFTAELAHFVVSHIEH
ncbi:transport protein [Legionella gratiana]|uniref:ABC transporter auxiliary component n=1 Tax=Legionella gratiana TaxID=45066 RepID=A0A378JHD0_9GAMM|nr:ABC-type transport auxiliary lipoprotein family protein [Legionella gratiana]KTD10861.1 transport protein [Legionella gratiana]STX44080.1 ABC transporter auxiliary component [Legionella gratiana]